jgi:hypothetical protein
MADKEQTPDGSTHSSTNGKHPPKPKVTQLHTPASQFKQTHLVQWGGYVYEIRRVSLSTLVASGKIANPLQSAAYKVIEGKEYLAESAGDDKDTPEAQAEARAEAQCAIDSLVVAVVAKPTLVLNEKDETEDTVWVGHISDYDKSYLLQLAQADVNTLANFRPGADGDSSAQDGEGVRDAAEQPVGAAELAPV